MAESSSPSVAAAPQELGFRDFALRIGCRPSYVTELKRAGRLVLSADERRVRVVESIALIEATRDPARASVSDRHAVARRAVLVSAAAEEASPIVLPSDDDAGEAFTDPATTSDARRRAKALADKAEADAASAIRENLIADGKLYRAAEVDHAVQTAIATLRATLERVPFVVAPQVVAAPDEAAVREVLAQELEHAQRELERQMLAIAEDSK